MLQTALSADTIADLIAKEPADRQDASRTQLDMFGRGYQDALRDALLLK
jgi:hypothetical protein